MSASAPDGRIVVPVAAEQAVAARHHPAAAFVADLGPIERDQWTVPQRFDPLRPFLHEVPPVGDLDVPGKPGRSTIMATKPTIRDFLAFGDIASRELDDAVRTYLNDPDTHEIVLSGEFRVDLRAAVQGDAYATAVLRDRTSMAGMRRHVVRRVLLDALPK